MAVRLVQHPNIRPNRCALLPNVAAGNERVGFFDFGTDLDREHVYVSVTAFLMMASRMGYVPGGSGEFELAAQRQRADEAEEKLAAAERTLAAVEVLKREGYSPARRPGRPKGAAKKEKVA